MRHCARLRECCRHLRGCPPPTHRRWWWLIRRLSRDLPADVYRWTGHFPERTRLLLRHLAERADALGQVYPEDRGQNYSLLLGEKAAGFIDEDLRAIRESYAI